MSDTRGQTWLIWRRARPLRFRLTVAFVALSFVALAMFMGIALVLVRSDVARFSRAQSAALDQGFASALADSYENHHGWWKPALRPILELGTHFQSILTVADRNGATLGTNAASVPDKNDLQAATTLPILVHHEKVGAVTISLAKNGVVTSGLGLQSSLRIAVAVSAALAALAAFLTAIVLAKRLARPVLGIAAAARALMEGKWSARASGHSTTTELNELSVAFNSLAANLEQEDAVRRTLTTQIAHELRTPLAILRGSCEALVDGVLPSTPATFQSIHDESMRLIEMVEDLEELADAQAARLHLEIGTIDLGELGDNIAAEAAILFERAGITFETAITPELMTGDERRIRQVLLNLLSNAAKFTPPGGRVQLAIGASESDRVAVSVTDTGIGIAPEEIERLFDRFWRSPEVAAFAGRGVGLAVVKELVVAHDGSVEVDSELARGSCFTITFPRIANPLLNSR